MKNYKALALFCTLLPLLFAACSFDSDGGSSGKTLVLRYDANGATGGTCPPNQSVQFEETITIAGNTGALVKAAYIFSGWNTAVDGSGLTYTVGMRTNLGVDLVLYAVWLPEASIISDIQSPNVGVLKAVAGGSFNNGVATISLSPFLLGQHEITQSQYEALVGVNPSFYSNETDSSTRPVEQVSWYEALVFCNKLSLEENLLPVYSLNGATNPDSWGLVPTSIDADWDAIQMDTNANGYRLPTENEWQFAAQGGAKTQHYQYPGSNSLSTVAWYRDNSDIESHSVGQKTANELGLYDMGGNVWEWVWDWHSNTIPTLAQTNPSGPSSSENHERVIRGGSYSSPDNLCLAAINSRAGIMPHVTDVMVRPGFRVLRRID